MNLSLNDLYASYISLDALNECFNKSLINKDIALDLKKGTVGKLFLWILFNSCLKGIYDYDSLINIDDEAIYKLDKMVINYLKNENDIINKESIILMRIRNSSLLKALNENVINDNHQIIFELDNEKDIDEILDKISSTNCKVIIGLRALRCLSFKSLVDYSRLSRGI